MEVHLDSEIEARLARIASAQGRPTELVVKEALERFLDYDDWVLAEVDKGLAAAGRGEFADHDEIRRIIDRKYPG